MVNLACVSERDENQNRDNEKQGPEKVGFLGRRKRSGRPSQNATHAREKSKDKADR